MLMLLSGLPTLKVWPITLSSIYEAMVINTIYINWLIQEATPTSATRKARRAVERESDCVLDRHGRRGRSQGDRMPGRDAHGQDRRIPGGGHG